MFRYTVGKHKSHEAVLTCLAIIIPERIMILYDEVILMVIKVVCGTISGT